MEVERLSRCNEELMASVEERERFGVETGENVECSVRKEEEEDDGDFKGKGYSSTAASLIQLIGGTCGGVIRLDTFKNGRVKE